MDETKTTQKVWLTEKKKFWLRLAGWIIFALIIPVVFILFRFDIFHSKPHIALGFWSFVVIFIIFVFVISMLKYIVKAMPYSMVAQCITGFAKIILPLGLIFIIAVYIRNNLDVFIQALGVVLVSEAVAIPLNPMPKWIHEHLSEEQQKQIGNVADIFFDKYFSRKAKGEDK